MVYVVIIAVLSIVVTPADALAWGPGTHLELASTILGNLSAIGPAASAVIEAYPFDFLYGNISADIVVAKNLVEEMKHCHNWKVGYKVLKAAKSDSQKAFAYGYLSHLAADTVAHNHYIPDMLIRSFSTRILRHAYWELRFDAMVDKRVWKLPKSIVKSIHRDNDRLLDSVVEDTPFSFRTNKTIFSGVITLHRFEQWHRMIALLSVASRWKLDRDDRDEYFNQSLKAMMEVLGASKKAGCLKKDPTGKHALATAAQMRKDLKALKKSGKDWRSAMDNALRWVCR